MDEHVYHDLHTACHAEDAGGLHHGPSWEHGWSHDQHEGLVGDPLADMAHWHPQHHPDTCSIAAQEFILNSLTGHVFSEEQLCAEAVAHGWHIPGAGTPLDHVGDLLSAHGIAVHRDHDCTLDDLRAELSHGHKVIVAVDADRILAAHAPEVDRCLVNLAGIPGQSANHAVEVIGVDCSDPAHPLVILNDPGCGDGRGMVVPADCFESAWACSDHFMLHTTGESASEHEPPHQPLLRGYYNGDSTYHWDTDNTNRCPLTGTIVSYG